ncbi:MAG: ribonuclease E/G, partial [Proteobacteria bacterium]|nr:ribonuclease E/G [Pseudomonadota bacterium]
MSRRLLISALPGETRAAWLEDGRLTDLAILRDDRPWVADNVYLGRVTARDKGLAAAFVDIGLERPGFLPLAEAPKGLSEGDAVAVRVAREPGADKGARLTARGLPDALRATAETLRPPALLRAAGDPIAAALAADPPPEEIVLDDPVVFQRAKARLAERPELLARLRLDLDPEPPFEREGVEDAIEALLEPRVALPSGGYLLIEPVRTLTAVDVNTGGAEGRGGPAAQALAVDLEAAAEIPRQLRLRALSGLIAIDFLALRDLAARKRVVEALKRGLEDDPQPGRVFAPRRSGLVEMTRRRARPALHEILTEPCGIGGSGRVKDPVTRAYEALRALARAAARNPGRRVALAA